MSKWQMRLWAINHFASAACDCSVSAHRLLASGPETGQMHHKLRWYTLGRAAAPAKCECSAMSTWDKKSGSALSAHAVICNSWLHRQTVCLSVKRISPKTKYNLEAAGDSGKETWKWTHLLRQLQGLDQKCTVPLQRAAAAAAHKQRTFQEKGETRVRQAEMGWDTERH